MVQDYVRTARAKGASNSRVLFVHVLRNAMIPILTLIGLSVGYIFWNAALAPDYPIILGVIVVTGFATVLGSLMADVLYAIADPRVRYHRA
jgi:peptide/nickel transport system permease protein